MTLPWRQLAAVAHPRLSRSDADRIYVDIGVGDTFDAIAALLTVIARDRIPLGRDLIATVASWLDCYRGQDAEPRLRDLLAVARLMTPPPTTGFAQLLGAVPPPMPHEHRRPR